MPSNSKTQNNNRIPPGQQLVAPGKWPVIGQREPLDSASPWQVTIGGLVETPVTLSLDRLRSQPQHSMTIDIHCVTRWSKLDANFSGVLLEHLLAMASPTPSARYVSFSSRTENRHSSSLAIDAAIDLQTLIAIDYEGTPLAVGHGGPIRCIVPGRYFYKSVKWVDKIELLADDRLGNWEAESGYHNLADPWLEQRYMAPTIDKRLAAKLIESRDFSGQELRSIDCSKRDLKGLRARQASLRDSKFNEAILDGVDFRQANLANAHFRDAKLANASFVGADVEGADFSGADLRGADFSGASMVGTSFYQPSDPNTTNQPQLAAIIGESTVIPADVRAKLFPAQRAFVEKFIEKRIERTDD
jgi:DMSO/TMAO reductase YedYZ molybdopterin-dependent catalytic subunit